MRRLTIFVLVLAVIYSAYWVIGARAVSQTAEAQVAALRADGWTVAYDDLSVRGFPSRFDTSVTAVEVASPDGQIAYTAPFVQALALSYLPNKVIAALPAEQQITFAGQTYDVQSKGLRASTSFAANTALALDHATVEAERIEITTAGQTLTFTDLLGAIRASGLLPNSYDVYLNAQNIALPEALHQFLAAGDLPTQVDVMTGDATIVLDRPLDRHTLPRWNAAPGKLRGVTLRRLNLNWGPVTFGGEGDITVSETGVPDGRLTVKVEDWQRVLQIAIDTGLIPDQARFFAVAMGTDLSDGAEDLTLPIRFQNGNMSIGSYPVGPAPLLH